MARVTNAKRHQQPGRRKWKLGCSFFPLVCLMAIGGALYAAAAIADVVKAHKSTGWPRTRGVIVESRIARSTGESITYSPLVGYRYRVDEHELTGDRIYFGQGLSSSDPAFASMYTDRYRVGDEVTVYYDPGRPGVSVLEPGISKRTFAKPVFGLGFVLLGSFAALMLRLFDPP